jgi:hypothetical protein
MKALDLCDKTRPLITDSGTLVWEKLPGGKIKIRANGIDREVVILPDEVLELTIEAAPAIYESARPRSVRKARDLPAAPCNDVTTEDDFPAPGNGVTGDNGTVSH